ncbi:FecCD family ABC transporter permease [Conexibacter woesei]|uniref:FecCD family ABC transporter permease n=1 Tax=Conexibacter woesei TaxID=191495 RepID=UPI0004042FD9|nr:iron chelate uptake ABC transporter family permease subunit [Conexibacter woesei]
MTAVSTRRALGLVLALAALAFTLLLSISVGAKPIALHRVWELLLHPDGSDDAIVIRDLRIPRTMLGLLVGSALGVAGALMQALTRNPLADPGLLGVNAGAATAIVLGVALLGLTSPMSYIWLGFAGAALASVIVYGVGAQGRSGATPVRLALAGTAVSFALTAIVNGITVADQDTLERYRFWLIGALGGHDSQTIWEIAPFMGAGLLLAFALARPLNALALGEDAGRALGAHVGRTRAAGAVAVTLLCGAATAAAGPIVFVGLTVPHVARAICGPDQRWVLPYSAVLAPVFLLAADVIGRVVDRPGEIEVGIVSAFLGGPMFIALIRRQRIAQL